MTTSKVTKTEITLVLSEEEANILMQLIQSLSVANNSGTTATLMQQIIEACKPSGIR